ncbi:unnamed protein product [Zymoseptoria tritici ST99CH_1A5]|uniref:Uncharacterized protein n=2 Tax=Zymoseptoria tritici TaxID=1047171 RepID=A0A2H1G5N9_ZYMTR|nr:unnamed protein product [Zymoseptoria tritici ST99CH_1E4]SMR50052.1 unnamed protein product [Zymoseptoria tritici ST99CH_3D1]SMY22752.1 unnamed protein product [Zymoseptoria tritici ST99CH_1A5]
MATHIVQDDSSDDCRSRNTDQHCPFVRKFSSPLQATAPNTLFVLKLHKPPKRQFTWAALYRAAAIAGDPVVIVHITPINFRKSGSGGPTRGAAYDRNFNLDNGYGVIEEKMDHQLKLNWDPRRFAHGDRNFVWKTRVGAKMKIKPMVLHETIKVWPKPRSRTGKMLHEVVPERLPWAR